MQAQRSLIDSLIEIESSGNDNAIGDTHLPFPAFGCLQIRLPVCQDVNRKFGSTIKPEDMLGNRALSIQTFVNYMAIWATEDRIGRPVTDEDRARNWNGGPNGYKRDATLGYWSKVQQALGTAPAPSAAPLAASDFATRVQQLAVAEWTFFGQQEYDSNGHAVQVGHKEGEDGFFQRIGEYWRVGVGPSDVDGRDHDVPWSAAFISWVMKNAGAQDKFHYSGQHSSYINQAIRDLRNGHCDIVVDVKPNLITVIGGNVGDSVTRRPLALNASGFIIPASQASETLFALMQNRIG